MHKFDHIVVVGNMEEITFEKKWSLWLKFSPHGKKRMCDQFDQLF
jgi:hypothetical protein